MVSGAPSGGRKVGDVAEPGPLAYDVDGKINGFEQLLREPDAVT